MEKAKVPGDKRPRSYRTPPPVKSAGKSEGRRAILWGVVLLLLILCAFLERAGLFRKWSLALGLTSSYEVAEGTLEAHFLDVGNGDAVFVTCGGQTLLIDAGDLSAGDTVVTYLKTHGVTRLDYIIATHADADHIGGMRAVAETFEVGNCLLAYMPKGSEPTTSSYIRLLRTLEERGVPVTDVKAGTVYPLGDASLAILGPVADSEDKNEQSVVCRVIHGQNRFLFTGDAGEEEETTLLNAGADLRAEVLKVGHHGSAFSSTAAFLKAVGARYGVISCGVDNEYDHPHDAALRRLNEAGVTLYRTDRRGTVKIVSDGETLAVETER